jgi:hypothetical protein
MHRIKQRAIFTNDAECDDMNSVVHLLLYANDIDIEGIVLSSSIFHYAGEPEKGIEPFRWAGGGWMWEYIDAYEKVYPNLIQHDSGYPTPDYLRSVICIGNVKTTGCMDEDTDGSELIRKAIFKDDLRPLWLLAGGGTNTISRALKHIENEYRDSSRWDAIYRYVCAKVRIYMIVTQDKTYEQYLSKVWPDIRMIHLTNLMGIAFFFNDKVCTPRVLQMMKGSWIKPNLLDKGPLLAHYNTWADGHVYPGEQDRSQFGSNPALLGGNWWGKEDREKYDMISEGDSPSFLYLIDTGLRSIEHPDYGGWGGRFKRESNNEFNPAADYWCNASDDACGTVDGSAYQFSRWVEDWMSEFAGRATWCVTNTYKDANHAPELTIVEGLDLRAHAGDKVILHARASDPDGDALRYEWFRYHEADSAPNGFALIYDGLQAEVLIPDNAAIGDTVHVICAVHDDGACARNDYMSAYCRVVITVIE